MDATDGKGECQTDQAFARVCGQLSKTDRIDAFVLTGFASVWKLSLCSSSSNRADRLGFVWRATLVFARTGKEPAGELRSRLTISCSASSHRLSAPSYD